jgi:predicted anti-sigma-YlaC factor YlaD
MSNNLNPKNDCKYFENKFVDYINGLLSEKDMEFCQNHLNVCQECKNNEIYADLLFAWKQLDKWPDVQPSKKFMAKLQHEIVKLEEKRRILWFKLDNFFIFARVPIMTIIFIVITFTNNLSYAQTEKVFDIHNPGPVVEIKIKEIKQVKVNDVLESISKAYRNSLKEKTR